jgi:hypothetical protein
MTNSSLVSRLLLAIAVSFAHLPRNAQGDEKSNTVDQTVPDGLKEALAKRFPNANILGEVHTAYLAKRKSVTFDLQLDRARCYEFAVTGEPGAIDLSLVLTVGDREVASDRLSGGNPAVRWCAPGKTDIKATIAMYEGNGRIAFAHFAEKPMHKGAPPEVGGIQRDLLANRIRQIYARFGKERTAITTLLRGNLASGETHRFPVQLGNGRCFTVISVATPSVRRMAIALLSKEGDKIMKDRLKSGFSVFEPKPCPKEDGEFVVEVTMLKGEGLFGVQIFTD